MNENNVVVVRVFGASTANACSRQDGWRQATEWVGGSLQARFGSQLRVEYVDVFSPDADAFPGIMKLIAQESARLPLVYVGDHLLSAGERISGPAIRRFLEQQGLTAGK